MACAKKPSDAVPRWYHCSVAMTLRTDAELDAALAALSAAEGTSRQEIIRRSVLERYERRVHAQRVEEASGRALERWADVLQRLGTA